MQNQRHNGTCHSFLLLDTPLCTLSYILSYTLFALSYILLTPFHSYTLSYILLYTLLYSHLEHQCRTKDTMELATRFQHANGSQLPYYNPVPDALGTIYYDDIHEGTTLIDDHYDVRVKPRLSPMYLSISITGYTTLSIPISISTMLCCTILYHRSTIELSPSHTLAYTSDEQ